MFVLVGTTIRVQLLTSFLTFKNKFLSYGEWLVLFIPFRDHCIATTVKILSDNGPLIKMCGTSFIKIIHKVCLYWIFIIQLYPVVFHYINFLSQVSEVQMHESGSETTSHTITAIHTENGNSSENESRLRSGQTPPPEAPRVSHSQLHLLNTSAFLFIFWFVCLFLQASFFTHL